MIVPINPSAPEHTPLGPPVDLDDILPPEPDIGFFNGLLTGGKALVNAGADKVANVVSLGFWDPPDVIAVDPTTDIGYDKSRFVADIAVETAAMALPTSGPGALSKIGRGLERADQIQEFAQGVNIVANAVPNGNIGLADGAQLLNTVVGAAGKLPMPPKANMAGALNGADAIADALPAGALRKAPKGTTLRSSNLGQQQGRQFRTDQLQTYEFDVNQPAHVRGFLANERRRIAGSGGGPDIPRTPPGFVQAHGRLTPAREGFDYSNSTLQGADLNQLEEIVRRSVGRP